MAMPETYPSGDAGGNAKFDQVDVVVSDLHLCEGPEIRVPEDRSTLARITHAFHRLVGRRTIVSMKAVTNPLEDFPDDRPFALFLDDVTRLYGDAAVINLHLMGDAFDPLAVTWFGRFADPPFETAAVYKMRKILRGHDLFFCALASFLERPNARIIIYAGNHDLFLCWKRVQRELVRRLVGRRVATVPRRVVIDDSLAAHISFVDHEEEFRRIDRGVCYVHGMEAEAHNSVSPAETIITHAYGRPLKRPELNVPFGSETVVHLVNRIKFHNQLVGRLSGYVDIWKNAALHRWGWGVWVGAVYSWYFIRSLFTGLRLARGKSSPLAAIRMIILGMTSPSVADWAKKRLKALRHEKGVRVIVVGHDHLWKVSRGEDGTYLNIGTWSLMCALEPDRVELRWKRFRPVEMVWRTLVHFLATRELKFARQLTKLVAFLSMVGMTIAFLLTTFPAGGPPDWPVNPEEMKTPILILLLCVMVSGIFRFFAVPPVVVPRRKLTFGLITHAYDGTTDVEVMEYIPEQRTMRPCM